MDVSTALTDLVREPVGTELRLHLYWLVLDAEERL